MQQAGEEQHGTDLRLRHWGGEARARWDSPVGGCLSCGERSGTVVVGPSLQVGAWLGAGTAPRPHPAATCGCSSRSHLVRALWGAPMRVPEDVCASAALEQAAALVSPRAGLPACDFSLSTAVLDRPPVHPFASLKGLQPLLQHLKTVLGEAAVTGVTDRPGETTAPFFLKPLQLPSF